ncbi:MAG: ATP-binding protein, partial [Candidatus Marinimicrobia bacterium]|nr:ATP-binding protein [Candidatus Neomarinimicrobiota bacterium]
MYKRFQLFVDSGKESLFLWGARQTGKSTLLKKIFPDSLFFDLLLSDVYETFLRNPSIFRERILAEEPNRPVIVDEIQRIPQLLNEIHWLIVNKNYRFILCGSSPRKILHSAENLLGGRALRYELYPLTAKEIGDFDLIKALNAGTIPRHYLSDRPQKLLSSYIGNYLKDEILAEAKIRKIGAFTSFLESAAFSNGETVNFQNIASDCSVSANTVKEYFRILEETMIGHFLPSYRKRPKRRVIQAPKFYFFDVGIANYLLKRRNIEFGGELFGKAFEHFIYLELIAHSHYSGINYPIYYWRTTSQIEVDFILGDQVAIEVKGCDQISTKHLKNLYRFSEEYPDHRLILVCNEKWPRKHDKIDILPWKEFL